MKYYTETIPVTLAEKLKEKGMPIPVEFIPNYLGDPEGEAVSKIVPPSFAFVFDWLMSEKGVLMEQTHFFGEFCMRPIMFNSDGEMMPIKDFCKSSSWHEAANAAIEKALTLI